MTYHEYFHQIRIYEAQVLDIENMIISEQTSVFKEYYPKENIENKYAETFALIEENNPNYFNLSNYSLTLHILRYIFWTIFIISCYFIFRIFQSIKSFKTYTIEISDSIVKFFSDLTAQTAYKISLKLLLFAFLLLWISILLALAGNKRELIFILHLSAFFSVLKFLMLIFSGIFSYFAIIKGKDSIIYQLFQVFIIFSIFLDFFVTILTILLPFEPSTFAPFG